MAVASVSNLEIACANRATAVLLSYLEFRETVEARWEGKGRQGKARQGTKTVHTNSSLNCEGLLALLFLTISVT